MGAENRRAVGTRSIATDARDNRSVGNTFAVLLRLGSHVATVLIGFGTARLLISSGGLTNFGSISVVNALVAYGSIVTIALGSVVARNVMISLERGDLKAATNEQNTALWSAATVLFCFGATLPWLGQIQAVLGLNTHSPGREFLLFATCLLALGANAVSGPLGVSLFVANRQDLIGGIAAGKAALTLILIYALMTAGMSPLVAYGFSTLVAAVLHCAILVPIHRALLPQVQLAPRHFTPAALRTIGVLGGWMVVNQVGALLFLHSDVIITSRYIGVAAAGGLAAAHVLPLQFRAFANLIAAFLSPEQTRLWANCETARFNTHLRYSIRLTVLAVAVPVGLLCGYADVFLEWWAGPNSSSLAVVVIAIAVPLVPVLGVMPAWSAVVAAGRLKIPAIVTTVMGIASVSTSVLVATRTELGILGVVVVNGLFLFLRNFLFVPFYLQATGRVRASDIQRELVTGMCIAAAAGVFAAAANWVTREHGPVYTLTGAGTLACLFSLASAPHVRHTWTQLRACAQQNSSQTHNQPRDRQGNETERPARTSQTAA